MGLVGLACVKDAASPENLASEARRALAERDKRLARYAVEATSTQGEATATHSFVYRAPNRVKGTMLTPSSFTLAFDGTRFFKLSPADKKLETFELKLPADKAAMFLLTQFSPFVPEGYRTPLLPSKGVAAAKVAHPRGPEAFELKVVTADEAGAPITVVTHLRYPTGDFLGKKTTAGARVSELIVEEEHCDAARSLCVPKRVVQREDGVELGRTTFTRIDLAPEVPNDTFTLTGPEGYAVEARELVESSPATK
jgi:outer membrane lipoprotein-sorting protein